MSNSHFPLRSEREEGLVILDQIDTLQRENAAPQPDRCATCESAEIGSLAAPFMAFCCWACLDDYLLSGCLDRFEDMALLVGLARACSRDHEVLRGLLRRLYARAETALGDMGRAS